MRATVNSEIETGQFVQFRGHNIQHFLQDMWWKVEEVTDTHLALINRHGNTARMRRNARYQDCHAVVWQPGDRRADG